MRILIVDDESAVHEQLDSLIPWEKLGWEIAGHAYNGEEAKRLAEASRPHLILTDIRMPLTDGLGFMAWLEHSDVSAKVIVLSGYGEFEYSRSAFKLGAYDYLLKPVQEGELLRALGKAVEQIQKDSRSQAERIHEKAVLGEGLVLMQDEFLTQIVGSSITDENEIAVQAQRLLLQLPETGYAAAIVRFTDFEEQIQARYEGDRPAFYYAARNVIREVAGPSSLVFRNLYHINEFVLFVPMADKQVSALLPKLGQLQAGLTNGLKMRAIIGVSGYKTRISKMATAYAEAQQALETLKLAGDQPVICYSGEARGAKREISKAEVLWKDIGLLFDLLIETGSLRDNDKLIELLEEAFHENMLGAMSVSDWKKSVTELMRKLSLYPMNEDMSLLLGEVKSSVQALHFLHTKESLLRLTGSLIAQNSTEYKAKSGKQLIEVIRTYIDEQYRTVSLDQIAERYYINKNYFCTLFKNIVGVSFLEYVTGLRIEQAKKLLSNSTLRAYEVADAVGYTDQRYFSQVFRKATGVKPTEFRQMAGGERGES
ncbi:two-component system response regulator YesN [Paenibacillus phyllosphaerae]|uniref:Two-component system response regulator YesN n=1 Tax=Paenibacillus phyllosphaerae TaxID=274593 RepID=A0A7W5B5E8_9BACL|nr:response regulator [Paenibacillus phyllosphaerae]MBB3114504.1 two-component system response regulator YesN [Paenibacillus phyllosphaerae]